MILSGRAISVSSYSRLSCVSPCFLVVVIGEVSSPKVVLLCFSIACNVWYILIVHTPTCDKLAGRFAYL